MKIPAPRAARTPHPLRSLAPFVVLLSACDRMPDAPSDCEATRAHMESLAADSVPANAPMDARRQFAVAALEAQQAPDCASLSEEEQACQLRAETLPQALACVRAATRAEVVVVQAGDVPIGPTSAPPLPMPRVAGGAR